MDIIVRLFVMAVSCLVFISVIHMLVKRQLNESNSILWLFIGLLTFVSGFFPDIITRLAALIGIDYPPTLLFLVSTLVLMMITFRHSMDMSKADAKINEMAITLSILQEETKRLRAELAAASEEQDGRELGSDSL